MESIIFWYQMNMWWLQISLHQKFLTNMIVLQKKFIAAFVKCST